MYITDSQEEFRILDLMCDCTLYLNRRTVEGIFEEIVILTLIITLTDKSNKERMTEVHCNYLASFQNPSLSRRHL